MNEILIEIAVFVQGCVSHYVYVRFNVYLNYISFKLNILLEMETQFLVAF